MAKVAAIATAVVAVTVAVTVAETPVLVEAVTT